MRVLDESEEWIDSMEMLLGEAYLSEMSYGRVGSWLS